jgi:eukaryotic-like serine/threonine-protein kinase
MPLPPSTLLGPYEILSLIGAGGMGEVYRARDKRLSRDVAIKVLGEGLAKDQDRRARFEREARAVAALNHPNIVSLFDIGTEGDIIYTVSELVEGESLRALLRRGSVPLRKIIDIAVQLADGMAAAHSAGITHRDLKPENVMVASDERVKILDFGLARQAGREMAATSPEQGTLTAHDTQPGTVMGTVNYMSPEQARGLPVNYHSDQFSFGLILYELVSGTRAFERETTVHTLAAIISEEPPPIETKVPPPLRWVIDRCLAKEPAHRYESTRDLYHDLRDLRDHLSEAYSSVSIEPVKAARNGNRFWKWITIPACILLAATIALLLRRDVNRDISRYRYTPFAMNPEGQSSPAWSPDGKSITYAGTVNGHPQVFVRSLNSPDSTPLTSNREYAWATRWSPDSKRILFFAPGFDSTEAKPTMSLYSIAAVGGEPELLAPVPDYQEGAEISPDNQTIAIAGMPEGGKATVFISSPIGSPFRQYEPAPFTGKGFSNVTRLRFAPNGKKLLLIRTGDSQSEEAWLLPYPPGKSTPHRVLTHFPARSLTSDFSWMPDNRHVIIALAETGYFQDFHLWIADTQGSWRCCHRRPLIRRLSKKQLSSFSKNLGKA